MSCSPSTMPRSRAGASRRSAGPSPECRESPSSAGSTAGRKPSAFPRAGRFLRCTGFGRAAFPESMVSSLRASTPTFPGWRVRSGVESSLRRTFYSAFLRSDGDVSCRAASIADGHSLMRPVSARAVTTSAPLRGHPSTSRRRFCLPSTQAHQARCELYRRDAVQCIWHADMWRIKPQSTSVLFLLKA